jgi:hypothetical protein
VKPLPPGRTIKSDRVGKIEVRLFQQGTTLHGLADGKPLVTGTDPEKVWRDLLDNVGSIGPKYFGYSGAKARFLRQYPEGFECVQYLADERDYKLKAKDKLDRAAPVENAATSTGFGEAVLGAFRATSLLYPVEKAKVQDILRGPQGDDFIRAAARFALGEGKTGLAAMERILKPQDANKWTIVTYLPFLWRPDEHMFLKPEVTKDFAERVGHRFARDYEAPLRLPVYESLLDLAAKTAQEIAELKPRDRVDVQSFIWVVGSTEPSGAPLATQDSPLLA